MSKIINTIASNKRLLYLSMLSVLVLFCVILNVTFSAFTAAENKKMADIKVGDLSFSTDITGNIVSAPQDDITKFNMVLTSNNSVDTKYELTYIICSDSNCNNTVDNVNGLKVEYSNKSLNKLNGDILSASSSKSYRIVITNTTSTDYYIKIGVNAGFKNNPLVLQNKITPEYSEDDLTIYTFINDIASSEFPSTNNYSASVSCYTNKGAPANASGTLAWDSTNSKWILSIVGLDASETRCHAMFYAAPDGWNTALSGTLLGGIKAYYDKPQAPQTTPGVTGSAQGEALMASTPDDYGTSYYFRGVVDHNYVQFANMCWRIVRITGNGAVKLILYNSASSDCTVTNEDTAILDSLKKFNPGYNKNAYIGYMYGTPGSSSYALEHANTNNSTMLNYLITWYNTKFNSAIQNILADVIWCNDKSISSGDGYNTSKTTYGSAKRLDDASPTLICPDAGSDGKLSKFTASDSTYGNATLHNAAGTEFYKIGLITADEALFAGYAVYYLQGNALNYLYQNTDEIPWWTMTPSDYDGSAAAVSLVSIRALDNDLADVEHGVRPMVALDGSIRITTNGTGDPGTASNPFTIVEPSS